MKYEILPEPIPIGPGGLGLYQIRALRSFGTVKEGALGGYVENGNNLQQSGNCWIYGSGRVHGSGLVANNALVYEGEVTGSAKVIDDAIIIGMVHLCGNVVVSEKAYVTGGIIGGDARIMGDLTRIVGPVIIRSDAVIRQCRDYLCLGMVEDNKFITAFRCKRGYKIAVHKFVGKGEEYIKYKSPFSARLSSNEQMQFAQERTMFVAMCQMRWYGQLR